MNWILFAGVIGILFIGLLIVALILFFYFSIKVRKINNKAPSKEKYLELKDPKNISERRFSIYLDDEKEINKIGREGFKAREESRESGSGGEETTYSRKLPTEDTTDNKRRSGVQELCDNSSGKSSRRNKQNKRKFRLIKRRRG